MITSGVYAHQVVRDAIALDSDRGPWPNGSVREELEARAVSLHAAHAGGDRRCIVHLSNWLPRAVGRPPEETLAGPLTLDEARLATAREHGYPDWAAVQQADHSHDADFEAAVEAAVHGEAAGLRELLHARPELVRMHSAYGHRATLLIYLAANGVETRRQMTPLNAVEIARILLGSGADRHAKASVYGGEWDALALLETSAHPAAAGVAIVLARLLKQG
jgi:hypothetical protein